MKHQIVSHTYNLTWLSHSGKEGGGALSPQIRKKENKIGIYAGLRPSNTVSPFACIIISHAPVSLLPERSLLSSCSVSLSQVCVDDAVAMLSIPPLVCLIFVICFLIDWVNEKTSSKYVSVVDWSLLAVSCRSAVWSGPMLCFLFYCVLCEIHVFETQYIYIYWQSVLNYILYGLLHVDRCVPMVCSGGIVRFVTWRPSFKCGSAYGRANDNWELVVANCTGYDCDIKCVRALMSWKNISK